MFGLFTKRHNRIDINGDSIFIDNQKEHIGKAIELETVFKLTVPTPEIKVFENQNLVHAFHIDTLHTNKDLTGQFLHSSIRVLSNSAVMIDGIISQSDSAFPKWTDIAYEAIRFQPFYLSDKNDNNIQLKGKGLFERGLHFSGTVTPTGVRNICICDSCNRSFTIQHFHSGFSELQYFYSTDSKETLIVPYGFDDIESTEEYRQTFFSHLEDIKTFAIYFDEKEASDILKEFSPKSDNEGEIGICHLLKLKIEEQATDERESLIGYDLIGIEFGGGFHTFHCHDIGKELSDKFGLTLNSFGLFDDCADWKPVLDYLNDEENGCEPVPWFVAKTKLITNFK